MVNDYIEINPNKLGGKPIFRGTRIPVYILFEYLEAGHSVEEFLSQYDIDPDLVYGFIRAQKQNFVKEEVAA